MRFRLLLILLVILQWHAAAAASDFELVADVNRTTVTGSSQPSHFVRMGDAWFFLANTPHEGSRVWRSDLTEGGTIPITNPSQSQNAYWLVALDGYLYYATHFGSDGDFSFELWRTDGSLGGAKRVATLDGVTGPPAVFAGWLWFPALLENAGLLQLWRTDGTAVEMVRESSGVYDLLDNLFAVLDTQMLFNWQGDAAGYELWRTDGTITGTHRVADLNPGPDDSSIYPGVSGVLESALVFSAYSDAHGYRLFVSDGTNDGTQALVELDHTTPVAADDEQAYFEKHDRLWATDGTAPGTRSVGTEEFSSISSITLFAGEVFFLGNQQSNGWGLWSHDEQGDQPVLDFPPVLQGFAIDASNRVLATAFIDQDRPSLHYRDDRVVRTITFGPSAKDGVSSLSVVDDLVFLGIDDSAGREPWLSDGTAAGTRRLANLARDDGTLGSFPQRLTWVGDTLFFAAGKQMWRWSEAGGAVLIHERPQQVFDPKLASFGGDAYFADRSILYSATPTSPKKVHWGPPPGSDGPITGIIPTEDRLYFTHDDSLYVATESGATYVGEFSNYSLSVAYFDGLLFFIHDDGVAGAEVWTTDGSAAGTALLIDVSPGPDGSTPRGLCATRAGVFFGTLDGDEWTLWVSDGNPAGTQPLVEIGLEKMAPPYDRERNPPPYAFAAAEDGAYFIINDTLWWSDGTKTGTAAVRRFDEPSTFGLTDVDSDIGLRVDAAFMPGQPSGRPLLLFGKASPDSAREVWATDGSEAGTRLVRSAGGVSFVSDGSYVFFVGWDPHLGDEIWRSDGTPAGTAPIGELRPGRLAGYIDHLTVNGDYLYFVGDDGVAGSEIWRAFIGETGCSGDCDGNGRVTIAELITAVRIALGGAPVSACSAADRNANSQINIAEVIAAVSSALSGC